MDGVHGATQASAELFLDSSSPLLRFASVLQAASSALLPNFRTVFCAAGGHRLQNSRDTTDHSLDERVQRLWPQLLVLGPGTAQHC